MLTTGLGPTLGAIVGDPDPRAMEVEDLEQRLRSDPDVQRVLSWGMPAASVEGALEAASDAQLERAAEHAVGDEAPEQLSRFWVQADGEALRERLDASIAEDDRFRFDTEHPQLDRLTARLTLAALAAQQAGKVPLETKQLATVLAGDAEDEGASGEDEEAAGDEGSDDARARAAEGEDTPVPDDDTEPADTEDPLAPSSDDDTTQKRYFIDDCPKCDQRENRETGPVVGTFTLDIAPDRIEEGAMQIRAFDVDYYVSEPCGTPIELDKVYLNGHEAGYLTGENEKWSTTSFDLDPAWFVPGENTIEVHIDTLGNDCWSAQIDWMQVQVNAATGDVTVNDVATDEDGYDLGDDVHVDALVETDAESPSPYPTSVDFNLHQPNGDIPSQSTVDTELDQPNTEYTVEETLTIPEELDVGRAEQGIWTVEVVAKDDEGRVSDVGTKEIQVGTDLQVAREDVEISVEESNPDSNAMDVQVDPAVRAQSSTSETKVFDVAVYVLRDGTRTDEASREITYQGSQDETIDVDPMTVHVDGVSDSTLVVRADANGDVTEVNEANNDVERENLAQPEVLDVASQFKGNFLVDERLPQANTFAALVAPPATGGVSEVTFTVRQGGTVVAEKDGQRAGDGVWTADVRVGDLSDPGEYTVEVVAVSDEGAPSEPGEHVFHMFDVPGGLPAIDDVFGFELPVVGGFPFPTIATRWDNNSPFVQGDRSIFYRGRGSISAGGSIEGVVGNAPSLCGIDFTDFTAEGSINRKDKARSDPTTFEHEFQGGLALSIGGEGSETGGGETDLVGKAGLGVSGAIGSVDTWAYDESEDGWTPFQGAFFVEGKGFLGCDLAKTGPWGLVFGLPVTLGAGEKISISIARGEGFPTVCPADLELPCKRSQLEFFFEMAAAGEVGISVVTLGLGAQAKFSVFSTTAAEPPDYDTSSTTWSAKFCPCALILYVAVDFPVLNLQVPLGTWSCPAGTLTEADSAGGAIDPAQVLPGIVAKLGDCLGRLVDFFGGLLPTGGVSADALRQAGFQRVNGTPMNVTVEDVMGAQGPPAHEVATDWPAPPDRLHGDADPLLVENASYSRSVASLAADERGHATVLYDLFDQRREGTGASEIGEARLDQGEWSTGVPFASERMYATPRLAAGDSGEALAAWEGVTEAMDRDDDAMAALDALDVHVARRAADGEWTAPTVLDGGEGFSVAPTVAVGDDGERGLVGWVQDRDGNVTTIEDRVPMVAPVAGGTVGEPVELAEPAARNAGPALAVLDDGRGVAVYGDDTDGANTTLRARVVDPTSLARDRDDPAGLGEAVALAEGRILKDSARVVTDAEGTAVAWTERHNGTHRLFASTVDLPRINPDGPGAGLAAGPPVEVLAHESQRFVQNLDLAADGEGLRALTWVDGARETVQRAFLAQRADATGADALEVVDRTRVLNHTVNHLDTAVRGDRLAMATMERPSVTPNGTDLVYREAPLGPDAAVTQIETTPANPEPGTVAQATVTVANEGYAPTAPTELVVTRDNTVVGTHVVDPIPPASNRTVTTSWEVPSTERTWTLRATLDNQNLAPDEDHTNEVSATRAVQPDLAVETLRTSTGDEEATLRATVANRGVIPSEPRAVTFGLEDDTGALERAIGEARLPALAPGQAGAVEATVPLTELGAGEHPVRATVETVNDASEENDEASDRVRVRPNLVLEDATVARSELDGATTVRATVTNDGPVDSPATRLAVHADRLLGSAEVPALAPGQSATVNATFPSPSTTTAISVVANVDRDARESARSDNRDALRVEPARLPRATLDAASVWYTPDGVDVTVRNEGSGFLPGEELALYRGDARDRPEHGKAHATKVENIFTRFGSGPVDAGRTSTVHVPDEEIVIKQTKPWKDQQNIRLGDLAADEHVTARLDPFGTPLDEARDGLIVEQPLVSVRSPTHPVPGEPRIGSQATFELSTAPGHGVSGYSWALDATPDTTEDTTSDTVQVTGLGAGEHVFRVRAHLDGGWTKPAAYPFEVVATDDAAPRTEVWVQRPSIKRAPGTFTVAQDTSFEVFATDTYGTVAETRYRVDDGPTRVYDGAFDLPLGGHTLSVWSVDEQGNQETPSTLDLTVEPGADTTAPQVRVDVAPEADRSGDRWIVTDGATATVAVEDPSPRTVEAPSGVASTTVRLDGETVRTSPGEVALPDEPGEHTLTVTTVDEAGNENTRTADLLVDATPPTVDVVEPERGTPVIGETAFTVLARDHVAGVAAVALFHEGAFLGFADPAGEDRYEAAVDTSGWPAGYNDVSAVAIDAAGGAAEDEHRVFAVTRNVQVPGTVEGLEHRYLPGGVAP